MFTGVLKKTRTRRKEENIPSSAILLDRLGVWNE